MADDIPDLWRRAATTMKEPLDWPAWPVVLPLPNTVKPGVRDLDLKTAAGQTIRVVIPLKEKSGPGLEGVRLRITAWPFRREHDVTATLEVLGRKNGTTIARIDAWPPDPHPNTRTREHAALRHLAGMIDGHHVHRFEDNARLGISAFLPPANLPVARPIDGGIRSFRQFLSVVESEFLIDGIAAFPAPDEWSSLI